MSDDLFSQIHTEAQAAPPPNAGDVFSQIHSESQQQPETGVWAGIKRNTAGMASGLYHAFADPASDQEKADLLAKVREQNAKGDKIPESLATDPSTVTLAYHRLIDAPA